MEPPRTLDALVRRAARRSPAAPVLICGEDLLTGAGLEAACSATAARLVAAGVNPRDRVGLYSTKGVAAVAGLFGILRAGAIAVPLEVTAPLSRTRTILRRCEAALLLAEPLQARKLALSDEEVAPQVLPLVRPCPPHDVPFTSRAEPHAPAYILFTSGSTGEPKGVTVTHDAALAFARWAVGYLGLTAADRCANHAPLHFDLSTLDLYATLLAGGAVVLVPPALTAFPAALARYLEQQQVTGWYSVPSALVDLLERGELRQGGLPHLRRVIYAGEAFPLHALRRLMRRLAGCTFFNFFGPTETNVCAAYQLPGPPAADARDVPIGAICSGLTGLILDGERRPAQQGELYVAGPTLMTGYWGMPEESQRVLVRLPHRPQTFCRTGDRVAADARGTLHFLGRLDTMVKVGGYRIELGEVELALQDAPGVGATCALCHRRASGASELVCFVVPRPGAELDPRTLERQLAHRLPRYMLPSRWLIRQQLPRTSSGKLDRQALACELTDTR